MQISFIRDKVKQAGLTFETHEVTTEDGYILQLFRVYSPEKRLDNNEYTYPVLMWHGLFQDAGAFIFNSNGVKAPAFIVAEEGMDVWLANSRGNLYSRNHLEHSDNQTAFWDFSYAEISKYDLPAVMEHIKEVTMEKKIAYIGYSQGTIQMFYGLTTNQDYFVDNISGYVALAPCALYQNPSQGLYITSNNLYWLIEMLHSLFGW